MEIKLTNALSCYRKKLPLIIMRTFIFLFCTTVFGLTSNNILSQNAKIVIEEDKLITVDEVFSIIKKQTDYRFIYREDMFKDVPKVSVKKGIISANDLLAKSLSTEDFVFSFTSKNNIVIKKNSQINKKPTLSQQTKITGVITDENGIGLLGANVVIKGYDSGVVSDFDGKYEIILPNRAKDVILIFSFLSYVTQEIKVGEQRTINVKMISDVANLDEIMVIGYGRVAKKDVTGAVARLNPEVLKSSTFTTLGGMIQGQLAGVQVLSGSSSPGTPVRIRIRGDATINDGADPLIVVDGVPMPNEFNLNDINPNDVESLDILKGASATAIYGSRALAGVIEITTKRGTKYTKPQITYSMTTGIKSLQSELNQLTGSEFTEIYKEGLTNYVVSRFDIRGGDEAARNYTHTLSSGAERNYYEFYTENTEFGTADTNWVDLLIGNAVTQDHFLSLRGGNKDIQYSFSYGKNKEEGILVGSKFERNSIKFNYDQKFSSKVKLGFSLFGGSSTRNSGVATIRTATNMRPDKPAFNEDGSYYIDTYTSRFGPFTRDRARDNPLVLAKEVTNRSFNRNITISPYGEFELFNDFKVTSRYSYYLNLGEGEIYYPSFTDYSLFRGTTGIREDSESETNSTTITNYISYLKEFGNHDIVAVLGADFYERQYRSLNEEYSNFADDNIQNEVWYAEDYRGGSGDEWKSSSVGYYGRVNYKFKDRYLLTGSMRIDGSSRFAPKNRYGVFPSLALAYIVSDEPFFIPIKSVVNLLKFRVSTGKTGNDRVGPYSWLAEFRSGIGYLGSSGVAPHSLGNDNLKWESSTEVNFGVDFGFLKNNRIRGSVDVYKKDIDNMLVSMPTAPSTGVTSVIQNFGSLTNKGIEISLSGVLVQKGDFTWDAGINVFKNKNKLTKLGVDRASSNAGHTGLSYFLIEEGQPLGLIYGYKTDGLFQSWEEIDEYEALNPDKKYQETFWNTIPGHIKFVDTSGDGYIGKSTGEDDEEHEDRRVIGNTQADFQGGVYTNLEYKGIRLGVRGNFQKGGDKYWRYGERQFVSSNSTPTNVDAIALGRWTPENPNAKYPVFQNGYYTNKVNDFWIYDASYFKIQEINLSYDLPTEVMKNTNFFKRVNIYTSVSNVAIFTKYPGYNIESYNSNPIIGGIVDNSEYPNERIFRLGVKFEF